VYDMVFGAPGTDERKMTQHLGGKMNAFAWARARHFDLDFDVGEDGLDLAAEELARVATFKCPKDKLVILQNATQIVIDLIRAKSDTGVDSLLPVLILVIIRARPPDFISHLNEKTLQPQHRTPNARGQAKKKDSTTAYPSTTATPPNTRAPSEQPSPALQPSAPPLAGASGTTAATAAGSALNGLASSVFTTTFRALGDGVAVLRSAAETAAGSVDGFAQGLMDRLRDEPLPPDAAAAAAGGDTGAAAAAAASPWIARPRSGVVVASTAGPDAPVAFRTHTPPPPPPPGRPLSRSTTPLPTDRPPLVSVQLPPPPLQPQQQQHVDTGSRRTSTANPFAALLSLASAALPGTSPPALSPVPASPTLTTHVPPPPPPPKLSPDAALRHGGGPIALPPPPPRFDSARAGTRAVFEAALSEADRGVLEDYELQLALALSLSEQEEQLRAVIAIAGDRSDEDVAAAAAVAAVAAVVGPEEQQQQQQEDGQRPARQQAEDRVESDAAASGVDGVQGSGPEAVDGVTGGGVGDGAPGGEAV
ncbi:hypothetical protein HK405_010454, partial [Cladochytrium tenue]